MSPQSSGPPPTADRPEELRALQTAGKFTFWLKKLRDRDPYLIIGVERDLRASQFGAEDLGITAKEMKQWRVDFARYALGLLLFEGRQDALHENPIIGDWLRRGDITVKDVSVDPVHQSLLRAFLLD